MGAMASPITISTYIAEFTTSVVSRWGALAPWELTSRSAEIVRSVIEAASADTFKIADGIAVHGTAVIESGAILKGPLMIGAGCFVAAGAYLRGGCWVGADCVLGPGVELKSSFVFSGARIAHFNYVGDSLLGSGVNLEAGSVICNCRNERTDGEVRVRLGPALHRTGSRKFGALVGDGSRIGANAVVAPGALLLPGSVIGRTALCDQEAR